MSEIADAIGGTVEDMFGGPEAETEDTVQVAAPEAEVATEAEAQDWDFEAAGRDLFATEEEEVPDFSALAEQELEVEDAQDELAPSEYDDEQTKLLKKQLLAERKKSEYHARRHLETARKSWEADVKSQPWAEFLPPDLSTIKAPSHREFVRQAKATARQNYTVLKPHYEKIAAAKAALKETALAEAKAEAGAAWGRPSVGGPAIPAAAEQQGYDKIENAVKRRDMFGVVKAMIDSGTI